MAYASDYRYLTPPPRRRRTRSATGGLALATRLPVTQPGNTPPITPNPSAARPLAPAQVGRPAGLPAMPDYSAGPAFPAGLAGLQAPAGSAGPVSIVNPDYRSIILGDPLYNQTRVDLQAQAAAQRATGREALTQSVVDFGALPPDVAKRMAALGVLDPAAAALARAATSEGLSQTAIMERDHESGLKQVQDTLAARGMLTSGGTGLGVADENQQFKVAQYTARRNLLNTIAKWQAQMAEGGNTRSRELAAALQAAAARAQQLYSARSA